MAVRRTSLPRRQINMKDLAAKLSLSVGTVSNAFNQPHLLREDTRGRIIDAATELGYVPNGHVRSLKSRRTRLIGVIVPLLSNPFYVQLAHEVQDVIWQHGYTAVLAAGAGWNIQREIEAVRHMLSVRAEGVVLISRSAAEPNGHLQALLDHGVKVVYLGAAQDGLPGMFNIDVDMSSGAYEATRQLMELGHRRLALVGPGVSKMQAYSGNRLHGIQRAIKRFGPIGTRVECIDTASESLEDTCAAVAQRLGSDQPLPTAFLGNNDSIAWATMSTLQNAGVAVPRDASVVGFDGVAFTALTHPALTTVSQVQLNLGARAATLLFDALQHPDKPSCSLRLKPELIVRHSTAKVPPYGRPSKNSATLLGSSD